MSILGYTPGVTTFTAKTDLQKDRIVRIATGSLLDPPEVEYTDSALITGITVTSAKAGQLISVRPLNVDGTFEIEALIDTSISYGTDLYITTDGTGRVTDADTALFFGQALGAVGASGQTVEVGGTVGAVPINDASDVTIIDAGNYYTSGNVEGALQEVGAVLANRPLSEAAFPMEFIRVNSSSPFTKDKSDIGGLLAGDTTPVALKNDNAAVTGLWIARFTLGTSGSTSSKLVVTMEPFYPVDYSEPISVRIQYELVSGTFSATTSISVLYIDGTSAGFSLASTTIPVTGAGIIDDYVVGTIPGGTLSNALQFLTISLTVGQSAAPSLDMDMLNITLDYVTPKLS